MSWALRPVTGIEQLAAFEEGVAAALAGTAASVLCQYAPPGIRIAGEIDYQAEKPLALAEAVRLEAGLEVNMTALAFIDAHCTWMVAAGFARLGLTAADGVRLVAGDGR